MRKSITVLLIVLSAFVGRIGRKIGRKNKDYRFFSAAVPRFNKTEKQVATERLPVHPATNRKEVTTLSDDRTFTRTPHYKPQGSHHLQFDLFHFQSTK